MRREIAAVVFFLKRLVEKGEKLESHKIELFVERLAAALQRKFRGHWYPENPSKGQAYRCIRVNSFYRQDPELLRTCQESGIQSSDLSLPCELTLWVDPGEVCCRIGEDGHYFSVASFSNDDEEDKDAAKTAMGALERVTSDYHSGSSSDEEIMHPSPLTISNSRQVLNPAVPLRCPNRMVPRQVQILPRPQYIFRPHGRAPHAVGHNLWIPPPYRGRPRYWDSNPNLPH